MWTIGISKVATRLHPGEPHGPEGGGQSRNTSGHPHNYSPLLHSVVATACRPLRTRHLRDFVYGNLAGTSLGLGNRSAKPGCAGGRTPRSLPNPRAHKPVFGLLARRYVLLLMNYMSVVSQLARDGLVFHASGGSCPVHYASTPRRSDTDIVFPQTAVEYSPDSGLPLLRGGGVS